MIKKFKQLKFTENATSTKQVRVLPILETKQKTTKTYKIPTATKSIKQTDFSIIDYNLTWCINRSDVKGEWSWGEKRQWSDDEFNNQISYNFNALSMLKWGEISAQKVSAKGDKRVPKHHPQEVNSIIKEARERWLNLGLEEYDTAFRFRFANKIRAWGIKIQAHFFLIWWEREHKIYPVKRG